MSNELKIEINFPFFEGFYNTELDLAEYISVGETDEYSMNENQFNDIDWTETNKNISIDYLNYFSEKLKDFYKEIGIYNIKFISVDSPRYYNYGNDKLKCEISLNKFLFISELRKYDFDVWEDFLYRNFKSYDGFMSFYPYEVEEWEKLILEKFDTDKNISETLFKFYLERNEDFHNFKNKYFLKISERIYEFLEY